MEEEKHGAAPVEDAPEDLVKILFDKDEKAGWRSILANFDTLAGEQVKLEAGVAANNAQRADFWAAFRKKHGILQVEIDEKQPVVDGVTLK